MYKFFFLILTLIIFNACDEEAVAPADIYGCTDSSACNYNEEVTLDNDSCEYAEENYDCEGDCTTGEDCLGECGGSAELDECGVCDGPGETEECG